MATETSWRMRGDAFEACSCTVTCPCNFGGDPTQGACEAIFALRFQEGHYGTTRLDGLHLVLYFRTPGNIFHGNWTAGFYLDQRATPEQVDALDTILSGQAGGIFAVISGQVGHQLPSQRVPITLPGIGPLTATALVAVVSDAEQFHHGRQFAAWLG
jgi:hypothetical protein